MNIYHVWADPREGVDKTVFISNMKKFMDLLVEKNMMVSYRITQMKLGFRSMDLPEYHIIMDFENMQQLDDAMEVVINNTAVDEAHVGFNQMVDPETIQHALYRDIV